jgi:DNA (cytosine-5)-methyltransferase 1
MKKLKILDLFSGIGGFSLGLHSTGAFETIKFVEKDPYCIKVLNKNFPNIPIEEDIKNVKGKEFEADVITGGFPCQPMSVAGNQKGTSDDRYLWPDMFRIIREVKPQFVIGENVQGIINIQDGMVLRQVQDDLEGEGFEVQCFLIPASGIGAWHKRNRVWIIGHSEHNGSLASESRGKFQTTDKKWTEKEQKTAWKFKRANRSSSSEVGNRSKTGIEQSSERKMDGNVPTISKRSNETLSKIDVSDTTSGRFKKCEPLSQEKNDSSKTCEDVSNTSKIRSSSESIRDIESLEEESNREKETGNQSSVCIETRSSNVSNTDSGLRRGRTTIRESGANQIWSFYPKKEEQTRVDIRSETIGRDAVFGEKQNVTHSNSERQQEQRRAKSVQKKRDESQCSSWWKIESDFRGVPNGISYELDKGRVNRIKALGNAIVPQIAREIGLAIKKVL